MQIDPVVALAAELTRTEQALLDARKNGNNRRALRLVAKIALLHEDFCSTVPTSAIGAAELLRRTALVLQGARPGHARQMQEIADRMADGQREISDIAWLRAIHRAMDAGSLGREGTEAAGLVARAIKGAARPVLVYRSAAIARPQTIPARADRA